MINSMTTTAKIDLIRISNRIAEIRLRALRDGSRALTETESRVVISLQRERTALHRVYG